MSFRPAFFFPLLGAVWACSSTSHVPPPVSPTENVARASSDPPPYQFSLLPKSFQVNPLLDMTVFTEMTADGRKLPRPTADKPVYYVAQPEGFQEEGMSIAGDVPPPPAHMDYFVRRALASSHYRSVPSPEVRPTLLIKYRWGTNNSVQGAESEDFQKFFEGDTIDRARMVGGRKLVQEIRRRSDHGSSFLDDDDTFRYLQDQATNSCYFVVLLAFDYEAMMQGERRLYWRTNMTVGTEGVSLRETLPPLIASAAPFFGRETAEPAITTRALRGRGKVEVGPLTKIDDPEALDAPAAPASATAKKSSP
jgi:hypothetical protein